MAARQWIRPFVPPILWSALSRAAGRTPPRPSANPRGLSEAVAGEAFSVGFRKAAHPAGTFFVPTCAAHRPAAAAVLRGETYEPATHRLVPALLAARPGDLVHAGTFFGDMLPSFSRGCPGTVYAFEPVLENFVLARLCVEANGLENVFLVNAALGEGVGIARIDTGEAGGTHRGGASTVGGTGQTIPLLPIDSLGLSDVSVIQLDVEGYEIHALRGAAETLARCGPVVMVEDNNRDCAPVLEGLGYARRGAVPGLEVWSRPEDAGLLDGLL